MKILTAVKKSESYQHEKSTTKRKAIRQRQDHLCHFGAGNDDGDNQNMEFDVMKTEREISNIELDIARLKVRPDLGEYFQDLISLSQSLLDLAESTIEKEAV